MTRFKRINHESDTSQPYRSNNSFRRNRTLTGSTSRNIASSNELQADLSSPRAHAHHLARTRRSIAIFLVLALLAAGAIYFFVSQLVANVTVQVSDETTLPENQAKMYSKTIDNYYSARPAERFRLLLNQQLFLSHVQASHPEIKQVSIEPNSSLGQANVRFDTRKPIARWSISGGRQYVDEKGVVFSVNYHAIPDLRIIDNSGLNSEQRILTSNRFLGFVGKIAGLASQQGYPLNQAVIPSQTTRQVELRLQGRPERYIVSIDRKAGEQAEDIARFANYASKNKLKLQYVDLRIKGKAFYK